jgi:hypothetical protein
VSGLWKKSKDYPIAVICSDLHLSLAPPLARSAEPDWLAAQGRALDQLAQIANLENDEVFLPIFYCGDIFHTYNSPPELVNWALKTLPKGYAIPGQHDLKHHNYKDIDKSAYATLVHAGVIENMIPQVWTRTRYNPPLMAVGMPWGYNNYAELDEPKKGVVSLLIAHRYVWMKDHSYKNPPKLGQANHVFADVSPLFDVAAFGDNHDGFTWGNNTACTIYNCGCLIPRRAQERNYEPAVGVLWKSGKMTREFLSTKDDKWVDTDLLKTGTGKFDIEKFLDELGDLTQATLDFWMSTKEFLDRSEVNPIVRKLIYEAFEEQKC